MPYNISFRERAAREYLDSVNWYNERSFIAAERFVKSVDEVLAKLSAEPTIYRNTYKQFHEVSLRTFPFAVIYFIDEEEKQVVITSLFHYKRNPRNKFKDKE